MVEELREELKLGNFKIIVKRGEVVKNNDEVVIGNASHCGVIYSIIKIKPDRIEIYTRDSEVVVLPA